MPGLYFEDFQTDAVIVHSVRRTVTETDNVLFSSLTMNPAAIHLDQHASAESEFGQVLFNSAFTLGLVVGLSVGDTTLGTTVGNLGFDKVRFPAPVFVGDTLRSETTVGEKRLSKSRPGQGIVTLVHRGYNQNNVLICECYRSALVICTPQIT